MKHIIYIFGLVLLLQACTNKSAQKSFEKGEYDRVVEKLRGRIKAEDPEVNFLMAEAYRKSNRLKEAAPYYGNALKAGYDDPGLEYYYAKALKANEQYDEAERVLTEYTTSTGGDERFKELARTELSNLDRIDILEKETNYYRIKNLDELNTEAAEYSPVYANNSLYFASNRGGGKIYGVTGTPFTDIYMIQSKGANVDLQTLRSLDATINETDVNEGSIAISPDGTSIIFAKGNSGKATGNSEVNLYFSRFRNGSWSTPRPLNINTPDSWDSTPALTPDGTTLYFSSTREGGYGGADLYSAQLNRRGSWVNVQNLGPAINTPGDEAFPFVSEDGSLYFASDGHPGFGNLDIFVATRRRGKITVENLGQPMNSPADDFGLYQFDLTRGFFTSNRLGGKGDDDIYTYVNDDPDLKIVNYYVQGTTKTTDDGGREIILPNTKVSLVSADGDVLDEAYTGDDGAFKFRVYTEEEYDLIGEKKDYFTTRKEFSTMGKSVDRAELKDFVTNVSFDTKILMDRIVLEKSIVLNNIYYDLDKADIRPDAAIVLDSLVQIMEDNPEIYIELGSHTDARADDDYNLDLSRRRARSAVNYIIEHGISAERITAKGYGETALIVPNAQTEEEHQRNRRTEFKVLRYNPRETQDDLPPTESVDEYDRFFDDSGR